MRTLPVTVRVLTLAVAATGIGMLIIAWPQLARGGKGPLLAAALLALLEYLKIDVGDRKHERYRITLGVFATFVALALFGPGAAMCSAALQALLAALRSRPPWYKAVYNLGLTVTGALLAAMLLPAALTGAASAGRVIQVVAAALAYVLVYTGGHALAAAIIARRPVPQLWLERYAWMAVQQLVLAVTGFAVARAVVGIGWLAVLLAAPLLLLRMNYFLHVQSERHHTADLQHLVRQLIETLAAVVDARDAYTFGHSTQVMEYATAMARQLGYSNRELDLLSRAALLHDIGKIGIPESVLFKPGRLTDDEYALMKQHAVIGYRIISRIPSLSHAAQVVLQHHEWYDGAGYPHGLHGDQIMRDARIVAVADALETMISDRPYRRGRSLNEALAEIQRCSGTQFDPAVVQALFAVVRARGEKFFVNSAFKVANVDLEPSTMVAAAREVSVS